MTPAPGSPHGGLLDQAAALADGRVTARELVRDVLARIEATRIELNSFRLVRGAAALAEADDADRRLAAGERLPLLGVPIAVKDDMDVAGEPTAFGCAGDFPPAVADSECVRRLRSAGAIIVGKTNTPEFGQWPFTEGAAFGSTRNPWNTDRTPGGSSGGSAAAVAAGLVPAALGSDGAGSVRVPAAWTHLVGIKPQRGRIPVSPGSEDLHDLTVPGPLARTVADAALLLDAAVGHRPRGTPLQFATPMLDAARREPGRLRIALSLRGPTTGVRAPLHPAARAATLRTAAAMADLGHTVRSADPQYGPIGPAQVPRAVAELHHWARRLPGAGPLDSRTRRNIALGRLLSGRALTLARAAERPLRRRIGAIFDSFDIVLTPTTATPPPRVGYAAHLTNRRTGLAAIAACPYTWAWNVLGWPAVSVPAGFTAAGLPLGAQLLGPADGEPLLVSLAAQLEHHQRWPSHWPRLP
ncbi:amidase [Kitasatospora sp. KL5]|uniref:amidase n=1 Tax=Kitasatospora sp. KL5 TaxID=3425125 RepID=UPI003D6F126B